MRHPHTRTNAAADSSGERPCRYDLHHAVMLHGGYTVASQSLDRRPAWPPSQHLDSLAALRQELRQFVSQTGLRRGCLPTASQLLEAGRGDLYQASRWGGGV